MVSEKERKLLYNFIDEIYEAVQDLPHSGAKDKLLVKFGEFYLNHTKVIVDDMLEIIEKEEIC